MTSNGFEKVEDVVNGVRFVSSKKDVCEVIRSKVNKTPLCGRVPEARNISVVMHAMNANI